MTSSVLQVFMFLSWETGEILPDCVFEEEFETEILPVLGEK